MLPVSHKPIKSTQFFQDHDHSPHLCRSGCNWRLGGHWKVTWGQMTSLSVFSSISRDRMEKDAQTVPNGLTRRAASENVHIDLFASWSDLDLTLNRPDLRSNFQIDLSRSEINISNRIDEVNTMVSFLFCHLPYQKSFNKKSSPWKNTTFHLMTPVAKTIDLRLILIKSVTGA